MQLYTRWQNSAGERVRIALHLKGIPYDYVAIGALPRGDYARLNPQGLMPALRVDGRVIAQSTAILEYLEEMYPARPLLPVNPVARAEVRAFGQLIAADLHPLNNLRVRRFLADPLGVPEEGVMRWYRHWIATAFAALEATLATSATPFCFGNAPGWADLHLVPQMANARRFDCDLASYSLLCAVEARCVTLDAFVRARPDRQPDYPGDEAA